MTVSLLAVLLAYFLGSVNGSLLLGALRGVDIRTLGSGNAGGTNALRTQGKRFALAVVAIDIGKGWIAVRVIPQLSLSFMQDSAAAVDTLAWLPAACGLAAILGHVWPLWHGFRGGKGAATLVGALAGLMPLLLVPVLGAWLACVFVFGFVGLATVVAAAVLPLAVFVLQPRPFASLFAFALAVAAFVAFTHRSNIERMRAGTEPRAQRLWLLRR